MELADGTRLAEFLAVLAERSLDMDCRSALALLILHSFHDPEKTAAEMAADMAPPGGDGRHGVRHHPCRHRGHQRMLSYWSFFDDEGWVRSILR